MLKKLLTGLPVDFSLDFAKSCGKSSKSIKALIGSFNQIVCLAVVFSIVTQRSSKVEANQNTAFDKRSVLKRKHKRLQSTGLPV